MLACKSSDHIRTSRRIKSFRSCRNSTGIILRYLDAGRIQLEKARSITRKAHWIWFEEKKYEHTTPEHFGTAGRLRVFLSLACSCQMDAGEGMR